MNASYRHQAYPTPVLPEEQAIRIPPQDLSVERTVLGSMLIDEQAAGTALNLLDNNCFYMGANRLIFGCMREMFEQNIPIDVVTLADHLKKKSLLEAVGEETYLGELAESLCTSANIEYYAGILREKANLRAIEQAGNEIAQQATAPDANPTAIIETLRATIDKLVVNANKLPEESIYRFSWNDNSPGRYLMARRYRTAYRPAGQGKIKYHPCNCCNGNQSGLRRIGVRRNPPRHSCRYRKSPFDLS